MKIPTEEEGREEFERQHNGRDLSKHSVRGTYLSPAITALWTQHKRTVKWMIDREKNLEAKNGT